LQCSKVSISQKFPFLLVKFEIIRLGCWKPQYSYSSDKFSHNVESVLSQFTNFATRAANRKSSTTQSKKYFKCIWRGMGDGKFLICKIETERELVYISLRVSFYSCLYTWRKCVVDFRGTQVISTIKLSWQSLHNGVCSSAVSFLVLERRWVCQERATERLN